MFLQHSKSPEYPEYLHVKSQLILRWDKNGIWSPFILPSTQARLTVGYYSIINLYLLTWSSKTLIFRSTEEETSSLIIAWPHWCYHGYHSRCKKNNRKPQYYNWAVLMCRLFPLLLTTWQSLREQTQRTCLWTFSTYLFSPSHTPFCVGNGQTRVKGFK